MSKPRTRRAPRPPAKAKDKLSLFVEAWLANGGNATAAAKAAGYHGNGKSLNEIGSRLLSRAREAGLIEERLAQVKDALDANGVLRAYMEIANGDIADVVTLVEDVVGKLALAAAQEEAAKAPDDKEKSKALDRLEALQKTVADGFFIDIPKAIKSGRSNLIHEVGFDSEGRPRVKLYSRTEALDALRKIYGLDGRMGKGGDEDRVKALRARMLAVLADPVARRQLQEAAMKTLPVAVRVIEEKGA